MEQDEDQSNAHRLSALVNWTRDLFPGRSLLSNDPLAFGGAFRADEFGALSFVTPPNCDQCARPLEVIEPHGSICGACSADPPAFARTRSALIYSDETAKLVLSLKRQGHRSGLSVYGQWMAAAGRDIIAEADALIPVPLHYRRLIVRGFNQAGWLATAVSNVTPIPVWHDGLKRHKSAPSQGRLTPKQRLENVRSAFSVPPKKSTRIKGARVVLVDDVYTTGATLNACAKALVKAGAAHVDTLTLARVAGPKNMLI